MPVDRKQVEPQSSAKAQVASVGGVPIAVAGIVLAAFIVLLLIHTGFRGVTVSMG